MDVHTKTPSVRKFLFLARTVEWLLIGIAVQGYCKKDCQVAHWKYHKEDCARAQGALYIEFLAIALYSSPVILHLLRILLALKVGLTGRPLPLDECHTAFFHIHINPCDDDDKAAVATGFRVVPANGKGPDASMEGYATLRVSNEEPTATVHIKFSGTGGAAAPHSFPNMQRGVSVPHPTGLMRHSMTGTRLWRQARCKADIDAGGRGVGTGNANVLVDFIYFEHEYVVVVESGAGDIETARNCSVHPELAAILQEARITIPTGAWTPGTISTKQA